MVGIIVTSVVSVSAGLIGSHLLWRMVNIRMRNLGAHLDNTISDMTEMSALVDFVLQREKTERD